jgi:hypothetical protein
MQPIPALWSLAALLAAVAPAAPPATHGPMPALLPAAGQVVRYRFTRLAQGNAGPRSLTSVISLRRKSATVFTLTGVASAPSEQTELHLLPGGALQIAPGDASAAADGAVVDVVNGLNRLGEVFAGQSELPHDGWSPALRLPDARGAGSVAIPLEVEHASASGFELHGAGETALAPPAAPPTTARAVPRRRGFRGGAGFPGSDSPLSPFPTPTPAGSSRAPVTVTVSLDGRVRNGAIEKLAIVETRSVTVDGLPYVNVGGWTFERAK